MSKDVICASCGRHLAWDDIESHRCRKKLGFNEDVIVGRGDIVYSEGRLKKVEDVTGDLRFIPLEEWNKSFRLGQHPRRGGRGKVRGIAVVVFWVVIILGIAVMMVRDLL